MTTPKRNEAVAITRHEAGFEDGPIFHREEWMRLKDLPKGTQLFTGETIDALQGEVSRLRAGEALFTESAVHEMLQIAYRLALPRAGDQERAPNQIAAADWVLKHEAKRAINRPEAMNRSCVWPNCACDAPASNGCQTNEVWENGELALPADTNLEPPTDGR